MRICSTKSEKLSRTVGQSRERNLLSDGVEEAAESVLEAKAEMVNSLLRLNDYRLPRENWNGRYRN